MASMFMKRNDRLPVARFTLKDALGTAVNIAGMTAKFIMRNRATQVIKVNAAAIITDGANGKCEYSWLAGDTDTAGLYDAEVEVTDAANKKMTFPNDGHIEVVVFEELA
jgi:hypothetical protein